MNVWGSRCLCVWGGSVWHMFVLGGSSSCVPWGGLCVWVGEGEYEFCVYFCEFSEWFLIGEERPQKESWLNNKTN